MRLATYTTGPTVARAACAMTPVRTAASSLLMVALSALALGACRNERHEPFDGDPRFRVSQPSRLYFANVRATSYYLERPRGTELEIYKLRQFSKTGKRPMLTPVIVQAYLKDEAYVFLRPNTYPGILSEFGVDFRGVTSGGRDTSGTYRLRVPTKPEQAAFAEDLRRSILRGDSLALHLVGGERAPIYATRAERGLFLTVMRDYDALTDK